MSLIMTVIQPSEGFIMADSLVETEDGSKIIPKIRPLPTANALLSGTGNSGMMWMMAFLIQEHYALTSLEQIEERLPEIFRHAYERGTAELADTYGVEPDEVADVNAEPTHVQVVIVGKSEKQNQIVQLTASLHGLDEEVKVDRSEPPQITATPGRRVKEGINELGRMPIDEEMYQLYGRMAKEDQEESEEPTVAGGPLMLGVAKTDGCLLTNFWSVTFQEAMDAADKPLTGAKAEEQKLKQVGRNDRCPCGSGKKFKKCCLAA